MAKISVKVTHEETADIDFGDIPESVVAQMIMDANYSISDLSSSTDWTLVKVEFDGKEV